MEEFRDVLGSRRGVLKAALINQEVFAGIGNIYSDEILFQSRLHPETGVQQLNASAFEELFEHTRRVLQTAIERGADPGELPGDAFLLPYRREGEDCPRGNGKIEKLKAAGRTAYFCPACQPKG